MGDLLSFSFGPRRGMRRGVSAADLYERGCANESSDVPAALGAYTRALAGRPDHADAHNNLGRLLHDRGDLAAAEGHYRLAICADASVALYWYNLGVVVEDRGRSAEAIAAYEHALTLDASFADAHYNLARQLELTGRRANDVVVMRQAVRHLVTYRQLFRRLSPSAG